MAWSCTGCLFMLQPTTAGQIGGTGSVLRGLAKARSMQATRVRAKRHTRRTREDGLLDPRSDLIRSGTVPRPCWVWSPTFRRTKPGSNHGTGLEVVGCVAKDNLVDPSESNRVQRVSTLQTRGSAITRQLGLARAEVRLGSAQKARKRIARRVRRAEGPSPRRPKAVLPEALSLPGRLLRALNEAGVDYLVVGPRELKDQGVLDCDSGLSLWLRYGPTNGETLLETLAQLGLPVPDLGPEDFVVGGKGPALWFGQPPEQIDLFFELGGQSFEQAWRRRRYAKIHGVTVPCLGLLRSPKQTPNLGSHGCTLK